MNKIELKKLDGFYTILVNGDIFSQSVDTQLANSALNRLCNELTDYTIIGSWR